MTKNVIVVDELGNEYGSTYPKRAKQLVKQGRAHFLTENMLCLDRHCLACPPNHDLEEDIMSEQVTEKIENIAIEQNEAEDNAGTNKYSIEYCLEQIEQIAHQTEHVTQAISELRQIEHSGADDSAGQAKAAALSDVVKCRETTNQKLLQFYEKVYDDLKAPTVVDAMTQKARLQEQLFKVMEHTVVAAECTADDLKDMFNGAFDAIRHIND